MLLFKAFQWLFTIYRMKSSLFGLVLKICINYIVYISVHFVVWDLFKVDFGPAQSRAFIKSFAFLNCVHS